MTPSDKRRGLPATNSGDHRPTSTPSRVGKLEAANRVVVWVNPEDSVQRAITLMMAHGYSQLPVMTSEREVKGVVSWESVARQFLLQKPCERVRQCMDKAREIMADASLFAAIPEVA